MSVLDELRERPLFHPQNKRLAMYIGVGLIGVGINQAVTVGTFRVGVPYVAAGLLGSIISTLANYVMNDSVTWRGRGAAGFGQWCWRGVKYVATRLVGIGIGTVGLVLFVDIIGTSVFLGNILRMGLGLLWGFGASEKWVWNTEDSSWSLDSLKRYFGEDKRE